MNTQYKSTCSNNASGSSARLYLLFTYAVSILFLLTSNVAFMSQAEAASCGGKNQYACKITFKRLKACDKGLHKNWKTKRCVSNKRILPPKQKNCGKLGQRACKITPTRLKACNLHLVRDKRTNRCRKIKSVIPPKQRNCGKLNQYACKVTVTRPKACNFGLVRDKRTNRCRKMKSIIPPKQQHCGKLGQYACKVTVTRLKACDFGLHRDKNTRRCVKNQKQFEKQYNCGKLNQVACKITIRRPKMCDFGLHKDRRSGRCVRNKVNPATILLTAKNIANESVSLIKIMSTGYSCFVLNPPFASAAIDAVQGKQREKNFIKELKQVIDKKDANAAIRLASSKCMKKTVAVAVREGYNTMTLGVSSGGSFVAGGFLDTGFAFDIKALDRYYKKRTNTLPVPTLYQTKGGSVGIQAGAGNAFSMGLSKSLNRANARGSKTQGATVALAAVAGVGTGVWFDMKGKLDGISAAISGGAEFEAAYNRLTTSIYNLDKPTQISDCGGIRKPACKKWERLNACNAGLRHNLRTGRCEIKIGVNPPRKQILNCGANGQRVCLVQERVPGCNPGLKIDFKLKRCVYK